MKNGNWQMKNETSPFRSLPIRPHAHAFINKLLHALPFVRLAGINVTLRIHSDAANTVELTSQTSAVAKARHHLERIAPQDKYLFVVTIGDVDEPLLLVAGKRDVPHRPVPQGAFRYERFFYKPAVLLEHLDPIVLAVADVD